MIAQADNDYNQINTKVISIELNMLIAQVILFRNNGLFIDNLVSFSVMITSQIVENNNYNRHKNTPSFDTMINVPMYNIASQLSVQQVKHKSFNR